MKLGAFLGSNRYSWDSFTISYLSSNSTLRSWKNGFFGFDLTEGIACLF